MKTFSLRNDWPGILSIVISILIATISYQDLPDKIPIHWNIQGEIDGYASKSFFSVYLLQIISLVLYCLFAILPKVDPKKENYVNFESTYILIKNATLILLSGVSIITILTALGYQIPSGKLIIAGVGLLFIIIGNVMGKVKPNYFVGVRLPWTLYNDEVWKKTHRFSAYVFVIMGFALVISIFLKSDLALIILILNIIGGVILIIGYSYVQYLRTKRDNRNN